MNKTTKVTAVGVLILVTAFSYSWLTTVAGRSEYVASNDGEQVSREVMPGMNGMAGMGMMDYQDGSYTATVKYEVPYGYIEPMTLAVTIADGVITESTVDFEVVNPVSGDYIRSFERYYEDKVVGQPVADIALSRVGGASLTNVAFDAALEKIKAEATRNMMGMMNSEAEDEVLPLLLPGIVTPEGIVIRPRPDAPTESERESVGTKVILVDKDPENTSDSQYQNGTYMVELAYYAWPKLYEPMRTQITLKDGIIVDAQQSYATIDYTHSVQYQQHFDSLYKNVVIGMPLDDAPIARVGQASETTDGFNDALEAIKAAAQES